MLMMLAASVNASALPAGWQHWSNVVAFVYPLNSWVGLRLRATPVPGSAADGPVSGTASFRLECPDGCVHGEEATWP